MDSPFRTRSDINKQTRNAPSEGSGRRDAEQGVATVALCVVGTQHKGVQAVQRVLDILFAVILLAVFFPLVVVIALLIKIDSPGPVLFKQNRVGKHGTEFPFYKFRSMVEDAESRREHLELLNERNGPVFKMRDDPRITRIGRLLRRCSLDELPQLLNVVRGEMSLIGPRPALPKEVARYTLRDRQRLSITPGLTGLWQVSGRASLSFERSIELDILYIEHQSLWLNLIILVKTIPAVLRGNGAY